MKTAVSVKGKHIKASAKAPIEAVCPSCGGIVVLRQRKLMNDGGVSFFWRHVRNQNRLCPARHHIYR